ncbi:MAG: regulator [Janthinobacterium lividum]
MRATSVHFLIPFALPPARTAAAVLEQLPLPGLAGLLERAALSERALGEDYQRTLPHERWLAAQFGLSNAADDDATPLAPFMMRADQAAAPVGTDATRASSAEPPAAATDLVGRWACIQPVHLQVAHDHLVLIDPENLALSTADAAELLAVARESADEYGITLLAPTPLRWYASGETLGALSSASPLRASGRSVEIWLPHEAPGGERSRPWMKFQNDVQMAWFEHPVNEAREAAGLLPANSIWLHAQGDAADLRRVSDFARQAVANGRPLFAGIRSSSAATRGLALVAGIDAQAPAASFDAWFAADAPAGTTLIELEGLAAPLLRQDWADWRDALQAMDANWFAPALAALRGGRLQHVAITLCGDTGHLTLTLRRTDLWKFWRRRPLLNVFVD